jgi:hypothetical protein
MADRCYIHYTKLDEFREWLKSKGWNHVPVRGEYEELRVWKKGEIVIFWKRLRSDHLTSSGTGTILSIQFLKEKKLLKGEVMNR